MSHFPGTTHAWRTRREPAFVIGHPHKAPTHEEIEKLAYSYWEARGCQGGSAWEDWFRAERELEIRAVR